MVREEGDSNDLIDQICGDPLFLTNREEIEVILDPINFISRSVQQVEEFIAQQVNPILNAADIYVEKTVTLPV